MFDVGGIFGALTISRMIDRRGVSAIAVLYLMACPAVGVIGFIDNSVYLLGTAIFLAGFCLVGITLSMNAVAGLIYPTRSAPRASAGPMGSAGLAQSADLLWAHGSLACICR